LRHALRNAEISNIDSELNAQLCTLLQSSTTSRWRRNIHEGVDRDGCFRFVEVQRDATPEIVLRLRVEIRRSRTAQLKI
jgi:hypothetical protein|tara:strand:- start:7509 stop:7745 length:237 start_codon:yes stop_codon:yes gene_type:complete